MTKPEDYRTHVDDDSFWAEGEIAVVRRKEAREIKHFLRMSVRAVPELKAPAKELWLEAKELHLIFSKIWRSGRK